MTEITQADRDAAAQYDVVEAFARHRKYGYDQGYYDGRQFDRMEERAAIVAWLHEQHDIYNPSDNWSAYWAEQIEAGKHIK